MGSALGGPDDGHTFRITHAVRGSYGVRGEEGHRDADWWSEPITIEVRAWNLVDALEKVQRMPFDELMGLAEDDEES